ncbi:ATP-binding protein [Planctellipticum variicoloris]|uniref:ATP-binding protein n=1 Tax=Planctellipticum variicoloris TaxID=3064265 RepID=UPI0030135BC1|nr:ATP-binding protein [Planctomycetaceae bacterium SH412]
MTMKNSSFRHAPPRAGAMIEALRGLGYSPATAIADIIDNSITAGADHVELCFDWKAAASTITVLDNGLGMDDGSLERAMRLGERSPLEERATHDLGRFGLGLKTASFSQCRRLTVASRREGGAVNCLRWDLDLLMNSGDDGWRLFEGPAEGSEKHLTSLCSRERGTVVVWESLDRVVTPGFREQDFLDLIDRVEGHLAMVFHRFLEGSRPRLRISINGNDVRPWDPFLTHHAATWSSPVERIAGDNGMAEVQCHVLPHHDRLTSHEHSVAAGPDGWTAQQGFYVYRNERLLVSGSWLGLGRGRSWTKEEAHRLARIRLDFANAEDSDWKIDIRKSSARPPFAIREQLTRLAEDTRDRARRVFAHRGQMVKRTSGPPVAQAWRVEHFAGGLRYRIDRDHPAVRAVLDDLSDGGTQIKAMLRILEETIPVQRIWLDTTESKEAPRTGFGGESAEAVQSVLIVLYRNLVLRRGMTPQEARDQLAHTEPFNSHAELVAALPDEPLAERS